MTDRRVIEGIGHHDFDYEGDNLLVDEWLGRPDDLKGQSVTIAKLLPPELGERASEPPAVGEMTERANHRSSSFGLTWR
jgi:hypothetical protein